MPPAQLAWNTQEKSLKVEAQRWVKERIKEHFESDAGYEPLTAREMMNRLDLDVTQPSGYARIVKADTQSYTERYALVRNTLEGLARQRVVSLGTTIGTRGSPVATTYSRPRDANEQWDVQIEGDPVAVGRARNGIREWLSLDGSVLDGITGIIFTPKTRKSGGTRQDGQMEVAEKSKKRSRKPRTTRGGD